MIKFVLMRKKSGIFFAVLMIAGLGLAASAHSATVSPDLSVNTFNSGSSFFIDIIGQTFPETTGGGFSLSFDPNFLQVLSVSLDGAFWDAATSVGTIDNVAGSLNDVLVAALNDPLPSGNFTVAMVEFMPVAVGTSTLNLTGSALNPWATGDAIPSQINPDFQSGDVTIIATIPVPAAIWLFGSALGFAGWIRFRAAKCYQISTR